MLPVRLEIEGLYSYKEKQVIDFETLTSSYLFGIFGKVGSGKSSIIDAITLAIYGAVERLGGRDDKNYNLMNLESNELLIDFECKIRNDYYKFRYLSKRNGKNHNKVNAPKKIISVLKNNEWIPVDKSGEEILNISYRNFKQAVVIPQGKFQEFISQGPTDRTKMLSEIFSLKKYDLFSNVKKLKNETMNSKIAIETLLNDIPMVNEEELSEKKELLFKNKEEVKNLKRELENQDKKRIKLSKAKDIFDDYLKTLEIYEKYRIINENLSDIKEKIFIFENIKPLTEQNSKIIEKLTEKNDYLEQLKEKKVLNEKKLTEIKEYFNKLKQEENNINKKSIFIEDFKNILMINQLSKDIEYIEFSKGKLKNEIKKLTQKKYETENLLSILEIDKNNLKENINNLNFITELTEWHIKNRLLSGEIKKLNDENTVLKSKLNNLKNNKIEILEEIKDESLLLIKKENLEHKINKLNLDNKLSVFTKELKENKACPLCGSLVHPEILEIKDVKQELKVIKKQLKETEKEIEYNKELKNKIELINSKITDIDLKITDNEKNSKKINSEISDLENDFKWSEKYKKSENIEMLKAEKSKIENSIVEVDKKINENRKIKEKIINEIQKNEIDLSKFLAEFELKIKQKDEYIKNLKILDYKEYSDTENEEINQYIQKYNEEIKEYDNKILKVSNELNNVENNLNTFKSMIPELASDVYDLRNDLSENEKKLESVYKETGYGKDYIISVLKEKFNLKQRKQEINDAEENYSIFKFKLNELIEKKSQNPYSEDEFFENKRIIAENREKLERLINNNANLETEIENNIKNLEKFNKNIREKNKIIKRLDNLIILESLFKGQKFVEYVANFYLKALVANANKRFSKLTKQQLSLEINKEGNFIVKDFLNGGRTRLLKTLSGGQTFQASFCIALALSESINTLNKQTDNFFFIDEGFGSLDKDSLSMVFNTLNTLRYEKRVVGVISHVEEFKREVDISINIKRDKKHGSIVKTSW